MTSRSDRILSALGLSIAGAGVTLQGIGLGTTHYQLAIQVIAVVCGAVGMFMQSVTRPISEAPRKDPPAS